MADRFYPIDNEILKMYAEGKKIEAGFGLYISSKENLQRIKGDLPRGQFYMSVGNVSIDLEISRGKAQRIINAFEGRGIIKLIHQYEKWEKKPSIWEVQSVVKSDTRTDIQNDTQSDIQEYSKIKGSDDIVDTQSDIQNNTRSDTSKKENIKKKTKKEIYYTSDSKEYRLAEYLYKYILKNNPKAKEPNLQKWAKIFDYIIRIDKRDLEEVKELIKFSQQHKFWYKNILSADKFRQQYDRLVLEKNEEGIKPVMKEMGKDKKEKPKKLLGWD